MNKVCDDKYSFHSCLLQSSERILWQERINFIKPIFWKTLGQIGALTVQISIIEGHKYITILSSNTHTKNPPR